MPLEGLPQLLREEPAFLEFVSRGRGSLAVAETARAFLLAGMVLRSERSPILVVTPTGQEADRLAHDLRAFLGARAVCLFPAWETLPFERVSPTVETMGRRLEVLWRLGPGSDSQAGKGLAPTSLSPRAPTPPAVVVAPVRALLQSLPPDVRAAAPVILRPGQEVDLEELLERLVAMGYRREYQVEHRGEVAVRGSILDVFPSTGATAVRIDLFGDEVDRLGAFDVVDQRSTELLDEATIFPCREVTTTPGVRSRAQELLTVAPWGKANWERLAEGQLFDGMEAWLPWLVREPILLPDLLGRSSGIVLVEPRRLRDRATDLADEEASLAEALAPTWGVAEAEELPRLHAPFERLLAESTGALWSLVSVAEGDDTPTVRASGFTTTPGAHAELARHLAGLSREGYRVVLCAEGEASARRMLSVLGAEGVAAVQLAPGPTETAPPPGVHVTVQPLERGFVVPGARVAVVAESDLTGRRRPHRRARPRARAVEGFFDSLTAGDYVVHHVHGVGKFGGMVRRSVGGGDRDYLLLEYRDGDKLYVPSDQIDLITPYTGGETPALHRLGGSDFARAKARVRSSVGQVAEELVALYRRRREAAGHAFAPDTPWQAELEESFSYTETPDQATAIARVKEDMEQPVPMDRLVCGDVGFGKTEVALRAVFKAVQDGYQAAVLVPTTLLAQQHFQTFTDRFAPYPVRVEVLSRFLTPAQSRQVLSDLAEGRVDVVVGTHRLLSGDVRFAKLGLLVVDEEQRFGVSHKEAIKALSVGVDVLTLTATPIPRTLELSLTGIRDLTLLETPPEDRQPILTYVGEHDERAVAEAVRRELLREGQVFYVHNRVADIERVATRLAELVPDARVAVAHGQMDEGSLEQVVLDFWDGAYDVLVCTTIIESGIDMPTVNTLVVDRADALGLGQLHQLRGRVGRSGIRAYAYLFYPPDRSLSEEAYERLRTIGEHTELGSGFKIAMRDLEIRGAGNLLGADQSGHIAAVGYDLYVRLVAEAVAEAKGEPIREPAEVKLDLPVGAHLPTDYVSREDLRLEAYRRLAGVTSDEEVDDIAAEWRDRYGPLPPPAEALLGVARLRAACVSRGVREITVVRGRGAGPLATTTARIWPLDLPMSATVRLRRLYRDAVYKADPRVEGTYQLVLPLPARADPAEAVRAALTALLPDAPSRPEGGVQPGGELVAEEPAAQGPAAAGRAPRSARIAR